MNNIDQLRYHCHKCKGEFPTHDIVIYGEYLYCKDCFKDIKNKDKNHAVSSVIGVILILSMMFSFLPVVYFSMDKFMTTFENMIDKLSERMEHIEFKAPDYNTTGNQINNIYNITQDDKNKTITITFQSQNTTGIPHFIVFTLPYLDYKEVPPP